VKSSVETWDVEVGAAVIAGESLMTVETDKVTAEVRPR
jgi:pyruvate/2-oxoglutarate dehydrogenase complex dihydrolipoamide acyltransferase (E2) component